MKPKVFVSRRIPEEGLNILQECFEVEVNPLDRPLSWAELTDSLQGCSALLCMLNDRVDRELLEKVPGLRVVANMAVGTDNIDVRGCTQREVVVTNTPGVLTEATADLTFALLLAVSRRVVEGDRYVRAGSFDGWDPLLFVGADLHGRVLGIIGMGRIGQAVARRARGFGMKILYHNRRQLPEETTRSLEAVYASLDEVVQGADFLSLHLPYSPEVHHLLDRGRLEMMKSTAYLINTARGAHVDEQALVEHLRQKRIAGAALDVYEQEPAIAPGLVELDNVVLAPHLGSAAHDTRRTMAVMASRSIVEVLEGRRPSHIVNPEVFGNEEG